LSSSFCVATDAVLLGCG